MSLVRMRQKMHDKLPMLMLGLAVVFAVGWIGVVLGSGAGEVDKTETSGTIAVVNKEKIEREEFEALVRKQLEQAGQGRAISAFEEAQMRGQVFDMMLDRTLRMQAAKKEGVRVSGGDIKRKTNELADEQIKQIRERLLADSKDKSDKALDAALKRHNTSVDKIRSELRGSFDPEMIREQVAMEKLIKKLQDRIDTTDKAIRESYDEVRFSQITVAAKGRSKEQAQKRATEIHAKLKGGDFAALAKEYSDDPYKARGGDRGFYARRTYIEKELADKVFNMKPGEVSEPIDTPYGYMIVKLDEKRSALPADFKDPKKQKEYKEAYIAQNQYLVQNQFVMDVQKNAKIDVRDPELRAYQATKQMSGMGGPAMAMAKAQEAVKELRRALEIKNDPASMGRVHAQLAYLHNWMRNPELLGASKEDRIKYRTETRKALENALIYTESNDLRSMLADINIEEGQYAKAIENLEFVSENAFDDPTTHEQLIKKYEQLKKHEPQKVAALIAQERQWLAEYNEMKKAREKAQSQITEPVKVNPESKSKPGG